MALTKVTDTLDAHQSLGSQPNSDDGISATDLKLRYDRDVNRLKTFINDILTAEIDTDFATKEEVAGIILGQITDGSLTDVKLSNDAGQIKDKVTKNIPNTIGATGQSLVVNATSDGTEWKDVSDGSWSKIAELTLVEPLAQVDFTNIESGYKSFRLALDVKGDTSAGALLIRFNDDATESNYRYRTIVGTGSSVSSVMTSNSGILLSDALPPSTQIPMYGVIEISNFSQTNAKRINGQCYSETSDGVTNHLYIIGGMWVNVTEGINKISIATSANLIGVDSKITLWGCK